MYAEKTPKVSLKRPSTANRKQILSIQGRLLNEARKHSSHITPRHQLDVCNFSNPALQLQNNNNLHDINSIQIQKTATRVAIRPRMVIGCIAFAVAAMFTYLFHCICPNKKRVTTENVQEILEI